MKNWRGKHGVFLSLGLIWGLYEFLTHLVVVVVVFVEHGEVELPWLLEEEDG